MQKNKLLSIIKQTGYHTSDNRSEQIDGVVNLNGKIFLIEAKWSKRLAASALYEFIGKIENKFFGTLGIFISYNELSENFINALRKGRKQNVIVIHGEDVKLLFKKDIDLKAFLTYTLEKLSYDNMSHVSVKEFINFKKIEAKSAKQKIEVDNDKLKEFVTDNILIKESKTTLDIEIALKNLNSDEIAVLYEILFNRSKDYLIFTMNNRYYYSNFKTFFSVQKPDFSNERMVKLLNDYFEKYIFEAPSIYLIHFLEDFIDYFSKINEDTFKKFCTKLPELFNHVDYEGENAITSIIERYSEEIPEETLNEIYKKYIDFYFSSREDRFPQKRYANELFHRKKLDKKSVINWALDKMKIDLEFYEDCHEFNIDYFIKTYLVVGKAANMTEEEWSKEIKKIYAQLI